MKESLLAEKKVINDGKNEDILEFSVHQDVDINDCHKLNQTRNVYHIVRFIFVVFLIQDYDEFDANIHKTDHIYQIAYEIQNFDVIITIINVSDTILYQIKRLIDIYTMICKQYFFIVVDYTIQQALIHIFMLRFKFNTRSYNNDLLLFYLIAMKMDDFHLIVSVINSNTTITVQVDHSYVILIVTTNESIM